MKKVGKFLILSSSSVTAIVVLVFLGAGVWVRAYGHTWLVNTLKERWGLEARIQKTRTNFFNSISFEKVEISKPISVSVEQIDFTFRPWRLLMPRQDGTAFQVQVQGWSAQLPSSVSRPPSKTLPFLPVLRAPFPIGFHLHDGRIQTVVEGKDYSVQNIDFHGRISPFGARAEASGQLPTGHSIHATAYARGLNFHPRLTLTVDPVPASDALEFVRSMHADINGAADGSVRVEADFVGKGLRSYEISSKNMRWKREASAPWISLSGLIRGTPEKLDSIDLVFAESIHLRGTIHGIQSDRQAKLTLEGQDVSFKTLEAIVGSSWPSQLEGHGSFEAHLEGPLENPVVNGNLTVHPVLGGVILPDYGAAISYKDRVFQAQGTAAGGQVDLFVRSPSSGNMRGSLQMNGFSIETLAAANGWSNVNGTIATHLEWENRNGEPVVQGPFEASGFSWGRLPPLAHLAGRVSIKSGHWNISTSSDVLTLQAEKVGPLWKLNQARLAFGPDSDIQASGTVDNKGTSTRLFVKVRNVPPDAWPPLVGRFPDITGGLDAEGSLQGSLSKPSFDLSIVFHELKFVSEGGIWNGTAKAVGDSKTFSLSNVHVDGGYTGELTFHLEPQKSWAANLQFDQAQPQLLADLLKKDFIATGTITGSMDLAYDNDWRGTADIQWKNGRFGNQIFDSLSAKTKITGTEARIEDLSLIQGSQALRGSGVVKKESDLWWGYDLTLQAQQFGPPALKADGEVRLQGSGRSDLSTVRGQLASSVLWLNGAQVENLSLSFDKVGDWLTVRGGAAPLFDFQVRCGLETDRISGFLKARSVRVVDVLKSYFPKLETPDIPEGKCNLDVRLAGKRTDPLVKAKIEVSQVRWRGELLNGEALVEISSGTLDIKTAKTELVKGGVVYCHGSIGLDQNSSIKIEGAGDNLNLNSVLHLLETDLPWEGTTDASFLIEGPSGSRTAKIIFSGQHQDLTPFTGAGSVRGEIVLANGELDLTGITVTAGEGYAKLLKGSRIFINKDDSGVLRLPMEVRNIHIGPLALFGGLELRGSWAGENGSMMKPSEHPVELEVFAQSLWVNQLLLEGNVTHLTVLPKHIVFSSIGNAPQRLSGQLSYPSTGRLIAHSIKFIDGSQERVFLDGELGRNHWDYSLKLRGLDAGQLRSLLDTSLSLDGTMEFDLTGRGSLAAPVVSGDVTWRNGHLEGVPLDTATGKLEWKDGAVTISNIEASRRHGYQLAGLVHFGVGEQEDSIPLKLKLTVRNGDANLVKDMWPDVVSHAKGSFEGDLAIDSHAAGYLKISDLSLQTGSYIPVLKSGQLQMRLEDDKLSILQGDAILNKGHVTLGGSIVFSNVQPSYYDLSLQTISSHGPSVRVPELTIPPGAVLGKFSVLNRKLSDVSRGDPLINVTLKGPDQSPLLAGSIKLDNTFFTYPPAPQKNKGTSTVADRWLKSLFARMRWDLQLDTGDKTRYENELVDAKINGSLHISGPSSDLSVNGRITSTSGSLVYTGSEFKINDAVLEVITPSTGTLQDTQRQTFVYLKANAERDVFYSDALGNSTQDTIVMAVDRSLLGEIQPRFYSKSNPNISPQKAIKLALGLDVSNPTTDNSLVANPAASGQNPNDVNRALRVSLVQLLDTNLASPMARAIARQTGLVDYIRVTYQQDDVIPEGAVASDPTNKSNPAIVQNEWLKYMKGTKVKLGRDLSSRLFADYSVKVDEYQNQVDLKHEVELGYRVHKNLFLKATSELDSERTLGRQPDRRATLENQWRFDFPRRKKKTPPADVDKKPTQTVPGANKG